MLADYRAPTRAGHLGGRKREAMLSPTLRQQGTSKDRYAFDLTWGFISLLTTAPLIGNRPRYCHAMAPWAIVTGGAGALGARVVSRLEDIGVAVVVLDRQQGFTSSDSVTYHQVDLADYSAVEEISTNLLTRRGAPRYVVAAAGLYERRSILQYDADAAERTVGANLLSLTYLLRFVLGPMLAETEGHVVALSSQVGVTGTSDPLYAASKAGVTAFMKSLAREYGRRGLTFTTVSCGPIDGTPMAQGMSPARREYYRAAIPIGRMVTVDEVVELVVWLLTKGGQASNGATFDLDGGLVCR